MLSKIAILFFALFISKISFSSEVVLDFTNNLKDVCTKNKSTLLSKKMFLTILKSEKQGRNPCDDEDMRILMTACDDENQCEQVLKIYKQAIYKYEGRVLGQ